MKWNKKPVKNLPKIGDVRARKKFAWFPCRVSDEGITYLVWLKFYQQIEVYAEVVVGIHGVGVFPEERWIKIIKKQ